MKHPVKKAVALFLSLLLLAFPFTSCDLFGKPEARSEAFDAVKDGAAAAVVYPVGDDGTWKSLANELCRVIKRITGVVPEIRTDETAQSGKEILLGATSRAQSRAALAALGSGGAAFSFTVTGDCLVIAAADTGALSRAISYFESQYNGTLGGQTGDGTLTFPADLSVTRRLAAPATEPCRLVSASAVLRLAKGDIAGISANGFSSVTGVATAGNVLYAALTDQAGAVKLIAMDLSTGKRTAESDALPLGDAGGMCYNSVLDLLVLTHRSNKLSLIDPATLTVRRTVTAGASVSGIVYDAANACYLAQRTDEAQLVTLNDNFTLAENTLKLEAPGLAEETELAGFCADSENIYLIYATRSETRGEGALLVTQSKAAPKRRDYYDLTLTSPLAITVDGSSFCVVSTDGEELAGKVTRVSFSSDGTVREPADFFNETNTATVDASYLAAQQLFLTYSFIKSEYKRNTVMQGACTDGKYGYFFLEYQGGKDANGNSNYSKSETHDTVIVKMDMATCELVKYSAPLKLGHSNDGCYNPYTGELIVVYNGNDKKLVKVIDTETLTIKEEKRLPVNIFSLAYNTATRQYVAGLSGGRDFAILNENFEIVTKRISTDYSKTDHRDVIYDYKLGSDLLTQGIDCDSRYVYFVLSGKNTVDGKTVWTNYLLAFDYEGNHIFTKVLPTAALEVENIFHIGKDIYVTCNGSLDGSRNPCYRLTVLS